MQYRTKDRSSQSKSDDCRLREAWRAYYYGRVTDEQLELINEDRRRKGQVALAHEGMDFHWES